MHKHSLHGGLYRPLLLLITALLSTLALSPAGRQAVAQSETPFPTSHSPTSFSPENSPGSLVWGAVVADPHPLFSSPGQIRPALDVAAGLSYTCAIVSDGQVRCWGDNVWGQLGNGTLINQTSPVPVIGGTDHRLQDARSLSASYKHICALTQAGGVKCWGRNYHGELGDGTTDNRPYPVDVWGLSSGVKQIAAGGFHTCALLETGALKCWGVNWHGQVGNRLTMTTHLIPVDAVGLSNLKGIGAGKYHTCVITESGGVQCFGYNMFGQLGNGEIKMDNPLPQDVIGLSSGIASVALGEQHTCALLENGTVKCWGGNSYGQLGDGTTVLRTSPVDVVGLTDVVALSAGAFYTCAKTRAGEMKCWGDNWAGQLGNGARSFSSTPTAISFPSGAPAVRQIAAGVAHSCAILGDGSLYCWGSNAFGQIGNDQTALHASPAGVYGLESGVLSLGAGLRHTCALMTSGGVRCWGSNQFGQLGNATTDDSIIPVDVVNLGGPATLLAVGSNHTCAAVYDTVRCWGYNAFGQLGEGGTDSRLSPTTVSNLSGPIAALTAGGAHTCALLRGRVYCWGENEAGQLGDTTTTSRLTPVAAETPSGQSIAQVAAGESHTCAVDDQGRVYCWGYNSYGQLGNAANQNAARPVAVQNLSNVTDIALGRNHTCAISASGRLSCWGMNYSGQLGNSTLLNSSVPTNVDGMTSGVADIFAGGLYTCDRLEDGRVFCWGDNWSGNLGDGSTYSRYTPIPITVLGSDSRLLALGDQHACAVTTAGAAKCWGANSSGQVGDGSQPWQLAPLSLLYFGVPRLSINYPSGQHGSFFQVAGSGFWPNIATAVLINDHPLTSTITTGVDGRLAFTLNTAAETGSSLQRYVVRLDLDPEQSVLFDLVDTAPLHPAENNMPILNLLPAIGLDQFIFLPLQFR